MQTEGDKQSQTTGGHLSNSPHLLGNSGSNVHALFLNGYLQTEVIN